MQISTIAEFLTLFNTLQIAWSDINIKIYGLMCFESGKWSNNQRVSLLFIIFLDEQSVFEL